MQVFSDEEILRFLHHLAPNVPLERITKTPTRYDAGIAINKKGAQFLIVIVERWPHTLGIRSILKIRQPSRPYSYLINGQAGKNTTGLGFWGESGPTLIPSHQQVKAAIQQESPEGNYWESVWAKWLKEAGSRAHETLPQIVENLGYENETKPIPLP